MKKFSNYLICMMALAVIAASMAVADGGWLNTFNGEYDTQATPLNSCLTCHLTNGGSGFNPYGRDMRNQPGTELEAILAIEDLDSDGDGISNVDEISGLFQKFS